jgi:SAM-dependent methyltransferase
LGHTTPQPDDLDEYYGPLYHGSRYGIAEQLCVRRRLRFVRAVASPYRVLDFGCGDGAFIEAASAAGLKATGVEMRPEHARSKGLTVVERVEDAVGPFDLITLWHSLEHVRSPRELVERLLPRLSEDGLLVVAVPNAESVQARVFGPSWFHLDVPRHLFHFTPRALQRLLQSCGLVVVRRWDIEVELDLFGWGSERPQPGNSYSQRALRCGHPPAAASQAIGDRGQPCPRRRGHNGCGAGGAACRRTVKRRRGDLCREEASR